MKTNGLITLISIITAAAGSAYARGGMIDDFALAAGAEGIEIRKNGNLVIQTLEGNDTTVVGSFSNTGFDPYMEQVVYNDASAPDTVHHKYGVCFDTTEDAALRTLMNHNKCGYINVGAHQENDFARVISNLKSGNGVLPVASSVDDTVSDDKLTLQLAKPDNVDGKVFFQYAVDDSQSLSDPQEFSDSLIDVSGLDPGNHTLYVVARVAGDHKTEVQQIPFVIPNPVGVMPQNYAGNAANGLRIVPAGDGYNISGIEGNNSIQIYGIDGKLLYSTGSKAGNADVPRFNSQTILRIRGQKTGVFLPRF